MPTKRARTRDTSDEGISFKHFIGDSSSVLASWIFGGLLLLLLAVVLFLLPNPTPFQRALLRFFLALCAALLAYFFVGKVLLRTKALGQTISATGGFALFILIQFIYDPFSFAVTVADATPSAVAPSEELKLAQQLLKERGLYSGPVNGVRDSATVKAITSFQQEQGLVADGYAGPRTIGLLRLKAPTGEEIDAEVDDQGMIDFTDGWDEENVLTVTVPQLKGIPGCPAGNIKFYKDAVPDLLAAFADIEKEGLLGEIKDWGGSFMPRTTRGSSSTASHHAYGMAFDININKKGDTAALVPVFKRHGFAWGGDFKGPRVDPFHFYWIPPAKR